MYAEILACEAILDLKTVSAKRIETDLIIGKHDALVFFGGVEKSDGVFAVCEVLEADGVIMLTAVISDENGRARFFILVDGDEILICEKLIGFLGHFADVTADHERRHEHTPHRKVIAILRVCAAAFDADVTLTLHADYEHIDIVEATC